MDDSDLVLSDYKINDSNISSSQPSTQLTTWRASAHEGLEEQALSAAEGIEEGNRGRQRAESGAQTAGEEEKMEDEEGFSVEEVGTDRGPGLHWSKAQLLQHLQQEQGRR
jgi:hypothetical protein